MTKWNMIIIISKKTLHCKLLSVEIQNVFFRKILEKYSIYSENICPNWIKEEFGYVKIDEIALLSIPHLLSYDLLPGQTLK